MLYIVIISHTVKVRTTRRLQDLSVAGKKAEPIFYRVGYCDKRLRLKVKTSSFSIDKFILKIFQFILERLNFDGKVFRGKKMMKDLFAYLLQITLIDRDVIVSAFCPKSSHLWKTRAKTRLRV